MNRKILAVDLDDTLLTTEKNISDVDLNALNRLISAGHILAIDSGRPIFGMKPVTSRYDIFKKQNVYLLGVQGSLGYYPFENKKLFISHLDKKASVDLAGRIAKAGLTFLGFDENKIYVFSINEDVEKYNKHSLSEIVVIDGPNELENIDICKIMAVSYTNNDLLAPFKNQAIDLSNYFESMFSSPYFLEFIVKGTSKGQGLKKLAEYLNISMTNTVACGDEQNDISMIIDANVGVCVLNGTDETKSVADYITTVDHNHGAIAEVVDKFILN